MHSELLNLYLFAYCVFKVLWMTGIGEGLILVYVASHVPKPHWVPTRYGRVTWKLWVNPKMQKARAA